MNENGYDAWLQRRGRVPGIHHAPGLLSTGGWEARATEQLFSIQHIAKRGLRWSSGSQRWGVGLTVPMVAPYTYRRLVAAPERKLRMLLRPPWILG